MTSPVSASEQDVTFSSKPWLKNDYLPPNPHPDSWVMMTEKGVEPTTLDALEALLRAGPGRELWNGKQENEPPALAAAPGMSHLVPVMEIPELRSALLDHEIARVRDGRRKTGWAGWLMVPLGLGALWLGVSVLGLILVAVGALQLWAWFASSKVMRQIATEPDAYCARQATDARFVMWTYLHPNAPRRGGVGWTRVLLMLGGWTLVAIAQLASGFLFPEKGTAIQAAALIKPLVASEPWRLLSGTMLHGGLFHFLMNMSAAVSFIALVERTAQRRLVALLWLAGALAGSFASVAVSTTTSVGASGGILAWLGFTLVMALRRRAVLPADFRQSVMTNLGLLVLIGVAGWGVVDNAAHVGGLLAGAAVGAWIFREPGGDLPLADSVGLRWTGRIAEACFALLTVFTLLKIFRLI